MEEKQVGGSGSVSEISSTSSSYIPDELLSHSQRYLSKDEDCDLELLVGQFSR